MFVSGADRPSEPASLRRDRPTPEIIRKTLALGKSLGAPLYLVPFGLIATWIIGVFFGAGFFLLRHELERPVSNSAVDLGLSLAEDRSLAQPTVTQALHASEGDHPIENPRNRPVRLDHPIPDPTPQTGLGVRDQPAPAPGKESAVEADRQAASVVPEIDQTTVGIEGGTPSGATGPRDAPESPHSASSRKRHQRRPDTARTAQHHPPVQAIQSVLQKHSRLLK
jgi:hypothetical protein